MQDVLQLAHVPAPGWRTSCSITSGAMRSMRAELPRVTHHEVADQQRNVLGAFAEGRKLDREDVQPVVQISAELSRLDQLLERAIRGGDDADVAPERPRCRRCARISCSSKTRRSFG